MKTVKSKKLSKHINTICNFQSPVVRNIFGETEHPTGTDPTNTTVTSITTINTHFPGQKLTL